MFAQERGLPSALAEILSVFAFVSSAAVATGLSAVIGAAIVLDEGLPTRNC